MIDNDRWNSGYWKYWKTSKILKRSPVITSTLRMAEWQDSVSSSPPLADSDNETESTGMVLSSGRQPAGKKCSRMGLRDRAIAKRRRVSDSSDASRSINLLREQVSGSLNEKYLVREFEDQQFISIKVPSRHGSQKPSRPISESGTRTARSADDAKSMKGQSHKQSQHKMPSRCCILL